MRIAKVSHRLCATMHGAFLAVGEVAAKALATPFIQHPLAYIRTVDFFPLPLTLPWFFSSDVVISRHFCTMDIVRFSSPVPAFEICTARFQSKDIQQWARWGYDCPRRHRSRSITSVWHEGGQMRVGGSAFATVTTWCRCPTSLVDALLCLPSFALCQPMTTTIL
jgi:hypothetical protein